MVPLNHLQRALQELCECLGEAPSACGLESYAALRHISDVALKSLRLNKPAVVLVYFLIAGSKIIGRPVLYPAAHLISPSRLRCQGISNSARMPWKKPRADRRVRHMPETPPLSQCDITDLAGL